MTKLVALTLALSIGTGCAATKGALSTLTGGSKQPPVTVVNNIEVAPQAEHRHVDTHARHDTRKAAVTGAVAGALVGGVLGYALDGKRGAAAAGLVGAATGALAGVAVEETR